MVGAAAFLSFFAAVWWLAGCLLAHISPAIAIGPIPAFILLFLLARRKAQALAPLPAAEAGRVARLVLIWSAVEGLGIFLAVILAVNLGHRELIPAGIGIAVALHFLPLARGIPAPGYYATAAAMLAAALAAIVAPTLVSPAMFCLIAAAILCATLAAIAIRAGKTAPA